MKLNYDRIYTEICIVEVNELRLFDHRVRRRFLVSLSKKEEKIFKTEII